jgi:hypothetical protein
MKTTLIYVGIAIFLLLFAFMGGCQYHKKTFKCPEVKRNTTYIHDTTTYGIPTYYPYYIPGKDSIVHDTVNRKLTKEDTLRITKNFYDKHYYPRKWEDTLLLVNQTDMVTENKIFPQNFSYVIKRPQTIINNSVDNSITYNHYVVVGITYLLKDPKYYSLDLTYQAPKFYLGGQYYPELKGFGVRAGATIFHFKKKK